MALRAISMPASKSAVRAPLPIELQRLVEVGVGDRPPIGPAQQGGEDLLGTGFLVGRPGRLGR